jgi:hypothetical protein
MKSFVQRVLTGVAPVFGATFGVAVFRAAELPFPMALNWNAWPLWLMFMSVVYCVTALTIFVADRVFGARSVSKGLALDSEA